MENGNQLHSLSRTQPWPRVERQSREYAEWIIRELTKIAVLMGEEISRERLSLMVSALMKMEIEPEPMRRALERAPSECKFFPRPAEIAEIAKREALAAETVALTAEEEAAEIAWWEEVGHCNWIAGKLNALAALMGERMIPGRIYQMTKELIDIEPWRLEYAIRRARRECKYFPKVAHLLERLPLRLAVSDALRLVDDSKTTSTTTTAKDVTPIAKEKLQ
jgi:hypothetical protein